MAIIDLVPLDSGGIQLNRPSHEVKWRKLTNVALKDGSLVPRVGFSEVARLSTSGFPNVIPSSVLAITELFNPGSTDTGREAWSPQTEILTPNGSSDLVAGWTGDHTDVDESVPNDGLDFMTTDTEGAQKQFDWSNPVQTHDCVMGFMLKGRARVTRPSGTADLEFFFREGGSNFSIGTVTIAQNDSEGSAQFQPFSIFVPLNPNTDTRLTDTDLDALSLVMEYKSGTNVVGDLLDPAGDGFYTGWVDATNGGAATFSDFQVGTYEFNANKTSTQAVGAISETADERQSFTVDTLDVSFTSVTELGWLVWMDVAQGVEHEVELFYRNGGTDFTVGTVTFGKYGSSTVQQISFDSTTNPETSAAWTSGEVSGGEFGLRNVSGTAMTMRSISVIVEGTHTGQDLEVDWLSVEVFGAASNTQSTTLATERIFSSNQSHIRVTSDDPGQPSLTDVTNSVAMSSSPPIMPIDHAVLYGQVYLVNGQDNTRRYPNVGNLFEQLSTNGAGGNPITGRTVMAFADRIFYGWVNDNSTVTPERIAWSRRRNGGDHTTSLAGDLDLLDTEGGIVKLLPLNENLAFVGKEVGIYALRQTGNARIPFVRDVKDFETRCIAPLSVKRIVSADGDPVILFLGWNPATDFNIFMFDGSSVRAVGDAIAPALRDDANTEALQFAIAGVEPISGAYWIGFAESPEAIVSSGYAMDMRSGSWTRFTLPFDVTSVGNWRMPDLATFESSTCALTGNPTLVLGGADNKPYIARDTITWDAVSEASSGTTSTTSDFFKLDAGGNLGRKRQFFTCELETGDFRLVQQIGDIQHVPYRLHIVYTNLGPFRLVVKVSDDGGISFGDANTYFLGDPDIDNKKIHDVLDLGPLNAHRTRLNIQIVPEGSDNSGENYWQIDEMYIEIQEGGTGGP